MLVRIFQLNEVVPQLMSGSRILPDRLLKQCQF